MEQALEQAYIGYSEGEVPVGAVIINNKTNKVIAIASNKVESSKDPTAHAEILAISLATKKLGQKWLVDHDIYVTLEPCPMCAQAISLSRLDRLYFGAEDKKSGGVDNGPRVLANPSAHHKPDIYGGIMQKDCSEILKKFFQNKRKD